MPVFSSTITDLVANRMTQPYYRFDGSNDTINMTLTDGISKNGSGSINMWYYGKDHAGIIFALHGASDTYRYFNFHPYSGENRIGVVDDVGSWQYSVIAENLIDKWSMITMVVNKAATGGTYTIYLNGVAKFTDIAFTGNYPTEPTRLVLGDYISGNYPAEFSTSNVSLYNFALSATEVKELYSGTSVPFRYKGAKHIQTQNYSSTTGGWNIYSTNTLVTDPDYLKMNGNGSNANGFYHYFDGDSFNIEKGKSYKVSITARVDTSGDNLSFGFANAANYQSPNTVSSLTWTETSFTKKSFKFTALDDGTAGNTYLYGAGTFGSGEVLEIDKMEMWQIGAIAEYDGSGISSDKWFDKSGNDYHGSISGATVENAPAGDSGLVYEEGSWTPTNNGTGWSHSQGDTNTYVRVGKMVTLYCYLQLSSGSSTQMDIAGLPFVSAANNYTSSTEMNHGTNAGQFAAHYRLYGGASVMYLHRTDTGAELYADNFNGTHQVFSITYKCA